MKSLNQVIKQNKNSILGAGTVEACTCVQLNRLFARFSQPVHMPFSNVQSYGPNGTVVIDCVVVVVVVVKSGGSASVGVKIHGFGKIRRSSIAASP